MPLTNPGIDWDSRVDSKPQTSALRPKEREREGERERERGLCALTPQEWSRECHRMYPWYGLCLDFERERHEPRFWPEFKQ